VSLGLYSMLVVEPQAIRLTSSTNPTPCTLMFWGSRSCVILTSLAIRTESVLMIIKGEPESLREGASEIFYHKSVNGFHVPNSILIPLDTRHYYYY
jgi:hypothetical protein